VIRKKPANSLKLSSKNSSSSPSSHLEIGSSSTSGDTINGACSDSPSNPSSNREEPTKKDSTNAVDLLSPKDPSSATAVKWVHKLVPPFHDVLKKKHQAHVDKMRHTLS